MPPRAVKPFHTPSKSVTRLTSWLWPCLLWSWLPWDYNMRENTKGAESQYSRKETCCLGLSRGRLLIKTAITTNASRLKAVWLDMQNSREGADGGGRRHLGCPPRGPPGRWAGIWSRTAWGMVRAPHPAETAGWWWWWTQSPRATPTLEEDTHVNLEELGCNSRKTRF